MPSGNGPAAAVVVLVTIGNALDGARLARSLVESRLAACVNVVPGLSSVYRWEGRVEETAETLLIVKTTAERYPELEKAVRADHPYDVPEILALPVHAGLEPYLHWLADAVD